MASKRKIASIAFTGAAATIAVGTGAIPAHAATTWTVKNSGTKYTAGTVKGHNSTVAKLASAGGTSLKCAKSHAVASGTIKSTATGDPAALATLKKTVTKFTSCSIPGDGGLLFNAVLSKSATFDVSTYDDGVTKGKLIDIVAKISGISNSCKAKISGSLPGSYTNTTHKLVVDAAGTEDLTVGSAAHCGNLTAAKKAYFEATYLITTPADLTISS
jgi:hypothetical protein